MHYYVFSDLRGFLIVPINNLPTDLVGRQQPRDLMVVAHGTQAHKQTTLVPIASLVRKLKMAINIHYVYFLTI